MSSKKLTVSIVNYNTGLFLKKCLASLNSVTDEADMEVYVVDNASADDSLALALKGKYTFKLQIIKNNQNAGFGRAHNQVLNQLNTEFVLILNPDVEVAKGVLDGVIDYLQKHPQVGAATPQIVLPDGTVDLTAHRGFPTPWASLRYYLFKDDRLYHLRDKDMNIPHEVDAITGAFLLTRKTVLDKVGVFDEDYFMYAEDIDLCFRIKKAGYTIVYLPAYRLLHHKGISTGLKKHSQKVSGASLETRRKMTAYFYSTMKIFYKKHMAQNYPFFVNWLVYGGITLKWWLAKRKLTV